MNGIMTIAGNEIRIGFRNRWVLVTTVLMAILALSISLIGSAPIGSTKIDGISVLVVSLASLAIFLVPLVALMISFDRIVGEIEQGTMVLLLAYPVGRAQILLGKFVGQIAIIGFAVTAGFGIAVAWVAFGHDGEIAGTSWRAVVFMMASSVLLGAVFVALGLLTSTWVGQRGTAAGIAVFLWLFFVLLFDMLLLGILVAGQGQWIPEPLFRALLLLNPADVYRMLNMSGMAGSGLVSGMTAVSAQSGEGGSWIPWAVLFAWTGAPLLLAIRTLDKKEV